MTTYNEEPQRSLANDFFFMRELRKHLDVSEEAGVKEVAQAIEDAKESISYRISIHQRRNELAEAVEHGERLSLLVAYERGFELIRQRIQEGTYR